MYLLGTSMELWSVMFPFPKAGGDSVVYIIRW